MAKKQKRISHPTPTASHSPQKVNNAEEDGTDVHHVQPISKTPSISNHEPMSSNSNPNPKSTKRPSENNNDPLSPKRTKNEGKDAAAAVVVDSKPRFQRIWSFDDEVTILKGMLDFIETGSDPSKYIDDFHSFIKRSLHAEASAVQLKEKIRKLKLKFMKKGVTPSFSNSHDSEVFELSKKIWGSAEAGNSDAAMEKTESGENKEGEKVKVVDLEKDAEIENDEEDNEATSYLKKVFQLSGLDKVVIKKGMELLGESKRMELKKLWKEVQNSELELSARRMELVAKHARLVLEAFKSSNH